MSRLVRRILIAAGALVVILAVAVGALFWYVDSLARRGIESGGTYALGVQTTVRSVNVGLLRGTVAIDGLRIANPQGFDAPTFLTIDDGRTTVALRTLRSQVIRIPQLHLVDVDVSLQRHPDGSANYQAILDSLQRFSRPETPDRAPDEPEQRLVINELVIRNITVHADFAAPGALGEVTGRMGAVTIPISEIRLDDVGRTGEGVGGSGVTMSELAALIVEALLAAAIHHGSDLLPADLVGDIRGRLAQLGNFERIRGTLDELGAELERAAPDDVRRVIRRGTEGLRDLLPRDERR
jgi:hypothetical protein